MKSQIKDLLDRINPEHRSKIYATRESILGIYEYYLDYKRFRKYSGPSDNSSNNKISGYNLEAQLIKDFHRIEKGLSLPSPKKEFGKAVLSRIQSYRGNNNYGSDISKHFINQNVESAIIALNNWNLTQVIDDKIAPKGNSLKRFSEAEELFLTRHSIRSFDPNNRITVSDVVEISNLAENTPSVCNRQAGRIHYFSNINTVKKILDLQKGNAGFTDSITDLLVITVESGLFTGAGERNQKWIDGALLAMTTVWAAHSLGIATCMLNWSKTNKLSNDLRNVTSISKSEDIIAVIAIGHPTENYRIARSPHRPQKQILNIHN